MSQKSSLPPVYGRSDSKGRLKYILLSSKLLSCKIIFKKNNMLTQTKIVKFTFHVNVASMELFWHWS